jgi:hypothetical protein
VLSGFRERVRLPGHRLQVAGYKLQVTGSAIRLSVVREWITFSAFALICPKNSQQR